MRDVMGLTAQHAKFDEYTKHIPKLAVKQAEFWMPALVRRWEKNPVATRPLASHALMEAAGLLGSIDGNNDGAYWLALQIVITSPNWQVRRCRKGPTLAHAVLLDLERIVGNICPPPSDIALCAFALTFLCASNGVFELVKRVYHFADSPSQFEPLIRQALVAKVVGIENVARAVLALGLQSSFSARELLLPVFAQSNTKLLDQLLDVSVDKRTEFVRLLDRLLAVPVDASLSEAIENFRTHKIGRAALSRSNLKTTVLRLVKKYRLPPKCCPNASCMQRSAVLSNILRDLYANRDVPTSHGLKKMCSFVGSEYPLQRQTLSFMISPRINDFHTAASCAKKWKICDSRLPQALASKEPLPSDDQRSVCVNAVKLYELKLDDAAIFLVDTKSKFNKFIDKFTELCTARLNRTGSSVVGIKCWCPFFPPSETPKLTFLQLATEDSVHMLDMTALKTVLQPCHWNKLVEHVFVTRFSDLLFFSMKGDLKLLAAFDPEFIRLKYMCLDEAGDMIMDLSAMCRKVLRAFPKFYPHYDPNAKSGTRLKDFVKLCLGCKLDKSQRKTYWESRPLKPEQIRYAASDATCLLEIYKVLSENLRTVGIDLWEYYNASLPLRRISYSTSPL